MGTELWVVTITDIIYSAVEYISELRHLNMKTPLTTEVSELKKFILPLFISLLTSAGAFAEESGTICTGKPEGITKDYYENGKLKTEWMCEDGNLSGITKLYYENGELEKSSNYERNVRQGVTYGYFDSGALKSACNYKDGKLDGMHKIFYEDGLIKEFTVYRDGVDVGVD